MASSGAFLTRRSRNHTGIRNHAHFAQDLTRKGLKPRPLGVVNYLDSPSLIVPVLSARLIAAPC